MQDNFFATLKLITGEEILAEVCPSEENDVDFLLVQNPIIINETMQIDQQKGVAISGLVPKRWLLYSNDDMTIVYKSHVICLSELDKFGTEFYQKALVAARLSSPIKRKVDSRDNVGYVGNIKDHRVLLEKMYDMSVDVSEDRLS